MRKTTHGLVHFGYECSTFVIDGAATSILLFKALPRLAASLSISSVMTNFASTGLISFTLAVPDDEQARLSSGLCEKEWPLSPTRARSVLLSLRRHLTRMSYPGANRPHHSQQGGQYQQGYGGPPPVQFPQPGGYQPQYGGGG